MSNEQIAAYGNIGTMLGSMEPDTAPSNIQAGDPQTFYKEFAKSDVLESGVWSCSVGSWRIESMSVNEVMHVLAGRIRITPDGAEMVELTAGDVFFLPKGWTGLWETVEDMQKLYVIVY